MHHLIALVSDYFKTNRSQVYTYLVGATATESCRRSKLKQIIFYHELGQSTGKTIP